MIYLAKLKRKFVNFIQIKKPRHKFKIGKADIQIKIYRWNLSEHSLDRSMSQSGGEKKGSVKQAFSLKEYH